MTDISPKKPRALRRGDTIGIISPSWFGGSSLVPRAERGISTLEGLGFNVKLGEHAFRNNGFVSDTAKNRVSDLHAMFADGDVAAIICTIGGDHSCHLLPLIDWDLITAHPKIFLGFSDITVLNIAIWSQTGLVTFNGPTLLTDWAEYPDMPEFSREAALRMLCRARPFGNLPASQEWTEEFLDWQTGEDFTRRRTHLPSKGWHWVHGGRAEGPLIGGCLESLQHLRGTQYWPDLDGAILFVETSEECPSPEKVDGILMDYQNMGVLETLAGLMFARPYGMDLEQKNELWEVVSERTTQFGYPVVGNMDIGHTSPLLTLPIGCTTSMDGETGRVSILDSGVTI